MEIKIDEATLNQAVTDAVVKSAIGKQLEDVIRKALSDLNGWNSPLKKAVEQVVHDEIIKLVRTQYAETIKAAVAKSLDDRLINELWTASWQALQAKLDR